MTRQQVPNRELSVDVGRYNLLTNGGFEVWQRGAGPFTTNGVYTADRWHILLAGTDTMSVQREANPGGPGTYAARIAFTLGSGAGSSGFYARLRPGDQVDHIRGQTISFSAYVACNAANAVRLHVSGTSGASATSAYHSGNGNYERLTVTVAQPFGVTDLYVGLNFVATTTLVYFDSACLVIGDVPTNYAPLHPADDLARCLRYYEVHGGWTGNTMIHNTYGVASQTIQWPHHFAVRKAVTPTLTKVGTWAGANTGQPVGGDADVMMYNFAFMVTAQGAAQVYSPGGSGAAIIAEANP